MSYLVFARKYRPQRFEDVVAQDHVTRTLQNAVKNDRIASGYLFCGPRGTGKTTTARVLAKALNCTMGPTPHPCGECSNCLEIAGGTSLDVLEIDAASNTGVDDMRTLRENVRYLPTSGAKRIYIIDEVHRLSGAAFDALLKTLEEPPDHVIFLMATTEPNKVPDTILSRTQRFDLKRVATAALVDHMKMIATAEKIEIEETALQLIARKADGSVRDALSLLDQMAAFAGQTISEETVISALGLVDRRLLFEFMDAVANQNRQQTLELVARVLDGGTDVADFVGELLEHLRLLLLVRSQAQTRQLADFTSEELALYEQQAGRFEVGDLLRLIKIAADSGGDLKSGLHERLVLEVAALKMAELESTVSLQEIIAHLEHRPPAEGAGAGSSLPKKKSDQAPLSRGVTRIDRGPEPAKPPAPVPGGPVTTDSVRAGWGVFLQALRQRNGMLASQLGLAEVRTVQNDRVEVVFGESGSVARQVVQKTANLNLITEALREHFGAGLSVTFDLDPKAKPTLVSHRVGQPPDSSGPLPKEPSARIKELVAKVDGEIIGIKKVP
ncbi:MAG: DNA polymerase III subunit gamma/tau [bacterium]